MTVPISASYSSIRDADRPAGMRPGKTYLERERETYSTHVLTRVSSYRKASAMLTHELVRKSGVHERQVCPSSSKDDRSVSMILKTATYGRPGMDRDKNSNGIRPNYRLERKNATVQPQPR